MCLGTTRVSAWSKFWVTCLGTAWVVTRVSHRVTRSGMTHVSNSGKVPSSDSCKESGTGTDKGLGKRSGKKSGKEAGKKKLAR
jgi:hypothetical protein